MMLELGVDRLLKEAPPALKGARVGLISNYTVVDRELRSTIDRFLQSDDFTLTTLFGPEHGVKNSTREGEQVEFAIDAHSGLPAYSLYGKTRKPSPAMMAEIDVLVLDLQDIGSRYYTNMNTMALALESAAESQVPCFVLDRPNPIGGIGQEGNILEPLFRSFVGGGPMPNRHGMTMGELALWFKRRQGIDVDLTVIAMRGWERTMLWDQTGLAFVSPSPNTTHLDMALLYPGLCLFEGTNLSLGRGTTHPFEVVGAPFIDGHRLAEALNRQNLPGVRARATYFVPQYSQWSGEVCGGIQLHVGDRLSVQPVASALQLMALLMERYPQEFVIAPPISSKPSFFQLLAGTGELAGWLAEDPTFAVLHYLDPETSAWQRFRTEFEEVRLY
ncbi:MAG: DUF1343 domain-containing protein [Firmicutes bacterium]|jgi:uncharacterized protein YbbC (DUF1343 family)|nr:DUF1343 domain-containing protein [Bacillota bacterium]